MDFLGLLIWDCEDLTENDCNNNILLQFVPSETLLDYYIDVAFSSFLQNLAEVAHKGLMEVRYFTRTHARMHTRTH